MHGRLWRCAAHDEVSLLESTSASLSVDDTLEGGIMSTESWQVDISAAEVYEREFIPALLGQYAAPLCDTVGLVAGERVLDVACGTGVVAREAAARGAQVTGLDLNAGMLAVARRLAPTIAFVQGDAGALPFPAASFERVTCQFALMYFPDRVGALREMRRVVTPHGTVALAVWGPLDDSPGYRTLAELAEAAVDRPSAEMLRAPFVLGDADEVRSLLREAGFSSIEITPRSGAVRFPTIEAFVRAEVEGSPLATRMGPDGLARLCEAARWELAAYVTPAGIAVPIVALLARAIP
jgi:SAM-dependent methyltransferase